MNKFVLGALAVTTASTLGFAKNGEDWMTLDREIESLASGMAQGGSGFTVDGWVKSSYADSGDVTVGGNDLGGFSARQHPRELRRRAGRLQPPRGPRRFR